MDKSANELILKASRFTNPIIVTNSQYGWVDFTSKTYMPETWKTLNSQQIKIVSAREMYKKEYPNNESEWKKLAFANLAKKLNKNTFLNLIVIGDSSAEHEAGKHLKSLFKNCLLKQVKIQRF